jgi:hypothetical protein
MLWIEAGLAAVAVALALLFPKLGATQFERLESAFSKLAARRTLSLVIVGFSALTIRAALLPLLPIPEPVVHDEFCYLLAADTFAHGRVTNPTHPMWVHFETFGIIQQPTYQCIAQPGQGLILAAGQLIGGHPFWGAWFSVGVMCAAIYWMLQGWLPASWALLGGVLAVLRFGTLTYWANSYWGGALAATGAALVLGALPRVQRLRRTRDAACMAIGLAILASSRPYEGFVFSVPIGIVIVVWLFKRQNRPSIRETTSRVVLPICLILLCSAALLGYYSWRVTGNPLRLPYQVERRTYAAAPLFIWQPLPQEPIYHHVVMQHMYVGEELQSYKISRTPIGLMVKFVLAWTFYLGPILSLPFLMMPLVLPFGFSWRDFSPNTRFFLALLVVVVTSHALETFFSPHYASPSTGLILALVLVAMRQLRRWEWRGKPAGRFLTRAIPVICLSTFMLRVIAIPVKFPVPRSPVPAWYQQGPESFGRAAMIQHAEVLSGPQLFVVRYSPTHEPFQEWVYNDADIDRSKFVWARDMGDCQNQGLLQYFKERHIWLYEPDKKLQSFQVYSVSPSKCSARNTEVKP